MLPIPVRSCLEFHYYYQVSYSQRNRPVSEYIMEAFIDSGVTDSFNDSHRYANVGRYDVTSLCFDLCYHLMLIRGGGQGAV